MNNKKIGLISLSAIVFSSMVGSGIFSLPQNMAAVAGVKAELIAWLITSVGILSLAGCFLCLSRLRPDLDEGVYSYAREGFGDLIGFFSAWGYWLCATLGSVAYLVVAFSAVGTLLDQPGRVSFGEGNTMSAFIGASVVLWLVHILISRGTREAALINLVGSIAKLLPLIIFLLIVAYYFSPKLFATEITAPTLHSDMTTQVKGTMLITLWVFIGIEGASVLSARAKNRKDVGRATFIGVLLAAFLYITISLLSRGIMDRESIAALQNPSMAGILGHLVGTPGRLLISIGLIVSVLTSYLSWILYSTEVPYSAAKRQAFPAIFNRLNARGVPMPSLWLTSITIQLCLVMVLLSSKGYTTLVLLATSMTLVPYLLVALYLLKLSFKRRLSFGIKLLAAIASIYGCWLIYAAGLDELMMSLVLYVPGLFIYGYSQYKAKQNQMVVKSKD